MIARRAAAFGSVALSAVWVAWRGFGVQTLGDYPTYFSPAMNALLAGHAHAFFASLPEDGAGGSLMLRAPGALVGKLLGGSQLAIFRFGALECVLALGWIGLWLARDMRLRGCPASARATVVVLCVAASAILDAIFFGHPEEALGAAGCVGAVLLAVAGRPALAGAALGLAIINKPWGVLAIAPVLLASSSGRRLTVAVAGAIVIAWLGSAYLAAPAHFAHSLSAVSVLVAHPQDLWWPLARLRAPTGVTPAYFAPGIVAAHAREFAVALALVAAIPLARSRQRRPDDCLALLALGFLLRCLLDPSNHVYYQLPLVIALCAWEARTHGWPLLALMATIGFYVVFHTIAGVAGLDIQFAAYLVIALPLLGVLAGQVLGRGARVSSRRDDRHRGRRSIPGELARPA